PRGITGDSNAVWFTEFRAGKIGRLTADGAFKEYVIPSPGSAPWGITLQFGFVWFTESGANKIGRLAADGIVTEFTIPTPDSGPRGIGYGPYTQPCFTEFSANKIACLDGNGHVLERPLPTQNSGPEALAGPTNLGDMWFVETLANRIAVLRFFNARTFADARIEEFPIPTSASGPSGVTAEYSQGSAWFTEKSAGQIGFISPDGRITEYPLADRISQPTGIFFDIETRFLESASNRLVEIQPDAVLVAGGGNAGSWETQFQFANLAERPVRVFAGASSRPADVCTVTCGAQGFVNLAANGSGELNSKNIPIADVRTFFVRAIEDGVLPSVRARIHNRAATSQSADLPTIRLSALTSLNPKTLTFPGAARNGSARSNLLISEVSEKQSISVTVALLSPDGNQIASGDYSIFPGDSLYLVDVIGRLGVTSFQDGQIRVTKLGDQGLLWGYLATINSDGAVSVFSGLNP
ncbi:MAG TPA: hypothetical protein VEO37_08065, partial [Thermoanaerobaculia bacterium]|nr:hypothetical protein [Thermoanaerobaculia bacterium]